MAISLSLLLSTIAIIILLIIVWQDFKFRAISWVLLVVLFAALSGRELVIATWHGIGQNLLFNSLFLGIQLVLLFVYFSLKNKTITNILDNYIGWGDLLFLIAITVSFSLLNYVVFLMSGFLFTIIVYLIIIATNKVANKQIPLAGLLSIVLIICLALDEINLLNLNDDTLILKAITSF